MWNFSGDAPFNFTSMWNIGFLVKVIFIINRNIVEIEDDTIKSIQATYSYYY